LLPKFHLYTKIVIKYWLKLYLIKWCKTSSILDCFYQKRRKAFFRLTTNDEHASIKITLHHNSQVVKRMLNVCLNKVQKALKISISISTYSKGISFYDEEHDDEYINRCMESGIERNLSFFNSKTGLSASKISLSLFLFNFHSLLLNIIFLLLLVVVYFLLFFIHSLPTNIFFAS
jgi:hypothetical protein